jgi:hypothetical protein
MKQLILIFTAFLNLTCLFSQDVNPDFRYEDKLRIKEAYTLNGKFGDMLWRGFSKIPFTILFITDSNEYLIDHPEPSGDFTETGYDSVLQATIYKRPRVFQKNFLATFAAVNGRNTILMGTPENTGRSSIPWIIVALHEKLHLMQYVDESYTKDVNSLDLAGNDSTGMWMLNYPFPYKNPEVSKQFNILTEAAKDAAFSPFNQFEDKFKKYNDERKNFKKLLDENDYRYFSLQIWQEGIAMYTELKFLEAIKDTGYEATGDITGLEDYLTYAEQYQKTLNNIKETSTALKLEESQRACFYYLGAMEGIILDRISYNWRDLYFTNKFYIENYYSTW